MNMDNPLGLPKGSIRAILAIMLSATACFMGISAGAYEMPEWLMTILTAVVAFYFGNRSAAVNGTK